MGEERAGGSDHRGGTTIIHGGAGPIYFGCGSVGCHSGDHCGNVYNGGEGEGVETRKGTGSGLKQTQRASQASQTADESHNSGVTGVDEEGQKERPDHDSQAEQTEVDRQLDIKGQRLFAEREPNLAHVPGRDLVRGAPAMTSPVSKNSPLRPSTQDYSNLFVGHVPITVTDDQLRRMFAPYGRLQGAKIARDHATGASKGCGYVKLSSSAEAQKAIRAMHGQIVEGHSLTVQVARPKRSDRSKSPASGSPSRLPASPPVARLRGPPGQSAFSATSPLGAARGSDTGRRNQRSLQGGHPAGASAPRWESAPEAPGANAAYHLPPPYPGTPPPPGPYDPFYRGYDQAREWPPQFAALPPGGYFPPYYGAPPPATYYPTYGPPSSADHLHPTHSFAPVPYFSTPPRPLSAPTAGSLPQEMEMEGPRSINAAAAILPGIDEYPDSPHQNITSVNNALHFPTESASRPLFDSLLHEREAESADGYWPDEPQSLSGRGQEHAAFRPVANRPAPLDQHSNASAYVPSNCKAAVATGFPASSRNIRERLIGLQINVTTRPGYTAEDAPMRMHADVRPQHSAAALAPERAAATDVTRRLLLGETFATSTLPATPQGPTPADSYSPMLTDAAPPHIRTDHNAGYQAGAQEYYGFSCGQGLASKLPQFPCAEVHPQAEKASSAYGRQAGGKEIDDSPLRLERTVRASPRLSVAHKAQPPLQATASPAQSQTGSTIERQNERSRSSLRAPSERGSASSSVLGKRAAREESEEQSTAAKRKQHGARGSSVNQQRAREGGRKQAQSERAHESEAEDKEPGEMSDGGSDQDEQASLAKTGEARDEQPVVSKVEEDHTDERAMSEEEKEQPSVDKADEEQEKQAKGRPGDAQARSAVVAEAAARQVAPRRRITPTRIWK